AAERTESKALLIGRLRAVLCLGMVTVVLSALGDLRLPRHQIVRLIVVRVGAVLAYAAAALALGALRRASWRRVAGAGVLSITLIAPVLATISLVTRDATMIPYLFTILTMGGAMAFPWGRAPQAALAALVTVEFAVTTQLDTGLAYVSPNFLASVLSAFGASIYLAHALERQRYERTAAELLQAGQKHVFELVAADAALADILAAVVRTAEEQAAGLIGSVLLVDEDGKRLRHGAAPGLP